MSHGSKALVSGPSRKNTLTKMVLATERTSKKPAENVHLSLAELRENLITSDAVETAEPEHPEGLFSRLMGRAREKAVTHASERPDSSSLFPSGPLFKNSRK